MHTFHAKTWYGIFNVCNYFCKPKDNIVFFSVDGKNVFVFIRFVVETDDKSKHAIPVLLVSVTGPNKIKYYSILLLELSTLISHRNIFDDTLV